MKHCPMWLSWIVLIIGIIYLIIDIMGWGGRDSIATWWNLHWWTAAFILAGLTGIMMKKK